MGFGVNIQIDISGAIQKIDRLGGVLDTDVMGNLIGDALVAWIDKNFQTEGGLGGQPWKPLKPGTLYMRRGGGAKILQDTGRLKMSFVGPPNPQLTTNVDGVVVMVGSSDKKAIWHEKGTSPYTIRPVTAKALTIPGLGGPITFTRGVLSGKQGWFRKEVHHPGLPARHMLPTEAQGRDVAMRVIDAYVQRQIDNLRNR